MSLLVINARLITVPASTDDPGYLDGGYLLVDDSGRIAEIGRGAAPSGTTADRTLDAAGAFVAPGFVSSHSHLFTSGLRGLGAGETLYGWCDAMLGTTAHMSAEQMYWATLHGSLDFLANGVTTAYNFTDPLQAWESMVDGKRTGTAGMRPLEYHTRQADGCRDAGLRFVDSIGMDATVGTDAEIHERFAASVAHTRAMEPGLALGASIMGQVQWSPREDAAWVEVEAMRRLGVTNQAHFLESPEAVEHQQSKFAMYRDAGALGEGMMFGHFIQTTPQIIEEAVDGGAAMSWQPASNGRLASGVALVPEMLEMGMAVGMGLDDQACTDVADPWQNMRMGMAMQRARLKDPLVMMPEQVLRLHTLGGAEIMGVADRVGSLEVGKFADFVVVDPTAPDVGPLWHPVRSYVLAMSLRNLVGVYVGGELVSDRGVSTNPLAAEASAKVHEAYPALLAARGLPH